jgi:DNA-binding response OmpR family regulator
MDVEKVIRGKKILIVEDEKDVVEVLIDLLSVCKIDAASSFTDGKRLLESNDYDLAILDIMGVGGFDLLRVANERKIPALMLTAHALSEQNLKKSAQEGASYYAPKEEMSRIATFVADVLDSIRKNMSPWKRLVENLGDFYDTKFGGTDWREKELEELIRKAKKHL